jgi:hypothetical protein
MVSGSNKQRSQRQCKEDQDLCQIEEVVEHRPQRKKYDGREREKETMELGGLSPWERAAEKIEQAVHETTAELLHQTPYGSQGVESATIREPSGRHNCGGLNRQRRQTSKHIIQEGADAEA